MPIDGVSGLRAHPGVIPGLRRGADAPAGSRVRPEGAAGASARPEHTAAARAADRSLPADAPAGTDPALWSVLTAQERAFFARAQALGPLTYGPTRARGATVGAPVGGRIDVRV